MRATSLWDYYLFIVLSYERRNEGHFWGSCKTRIPSTWSSSPNHLHRLNFQILSSLCQCHTLHTSGWSAHSVYCTCVISVLFVIFSLTRRSSQPFFFYIRKNRMDSVVLTEPWLTTTVYNKCDTNIFLFLFSTLGKVP